MLQNYSKSCGLDVANCKGPLTSLKFPNAVWPIAFLIDMISTLKGSQFYFHLNLGIRVIPVIFVSKHRLWVLIEAVLTCTHNQCFEQKN